MINVWIQLKLEKYDKEKKICTSNLLTGIFQFSQLPFKIAVGDSGGSFTVHLPLGIEDIYCLATLQYDKKTAKMLIKNI